MVGHTPKHCRRRRARYAPFCASSWRSPAPGSAV
jgi:hypothetical protein